MVWEGKPKWTGQKIEFGSIKGKLYPSINGEPFFMTIEDCNDFFITLFSTEENLRATVDRFMTKIKTMMGNDADGNIISLPIPAYDISKLEDQSLINELFRLKIRFMCDPVVIDDHHTRWIEAVKEGDLYKYFDVDNN